MDTFERILNEYEDAGEGYRLDLFLAYRDLRDRFREIERPDCPEAPAAREERVLRNVPVLWG